MAQKTSIERDRPRVSIGVPVYNGERYLAETLDTLLAQTYSDFELIICDNASTDRTEQIGRAYAANDPRVRYVRNPANLGAAKNYRLVFELSSGEYFKWQPSDDLCAPEFLARCVDVLDHQSSVVLAYTRTTLIDEHGRVISEYQDNLHLQSPSARERFFQLHLRLRLCNPMYGLIRADRLRRTALIGNFIGGDIPLLAELTLYGTFWEIPEFLFCRRFHPQASTSLKKDEQVLEFYDPQKKARIPLTEWRHLLANFRAVRRSPLPISEKIHLALYVARRGVWSRTKLLGELSTATRLWVRRALGT